MTKIVEQIVGQVKALSDEELDELLSWLAEYELERPDEWDKEIVRDSQEGGRLGPLLERARADIIAGRTRPL